MNDLLLPALGLLLIVILLVARTRLRTRPRIDEALDQVDLGPDALTEQDLDEVAVEELERMLEEPPPPSTAPAPAGPPVSRLKGGLTKTRSALASTLKALKIRDKLDSQSWDEIEEALIRADVGINATDMVLTNLRASSTSPGDLAAALRRELVQILSKGDSTLQTVSGEVAVWLVIGVNGVGKTTSIAKLASRLSALDKSVVLVAGDTFRAAAIEQLGAWAERLGVHMVKHAAGADPGAVVYDAIQHAKAKKLDVVIVDTAGRLHTKSNLMDELKKIRRIAEREAGGIAEALLVLDATVGQNGLAQARAFQEAMGATGVILTKLDGSAKGGIVIAIQEELGIPVKAVGVGEGIEDLETFDPESFVDALLE
ncbi:MAG: signal recognition particle-docking protein FtsY [Actinomycetota bacterium]